MSAALQEKKKSIAVFLILSFVVTFNIAAALNFDLIRDRVTCDVLRKAYEGVWYQPQCELDGKFKNPQCFYPGFHLCCCINNVLPANTTATWLGDCTRFGDKGPEKLPICKQGIMLHRGTSIE